MSAALPPMPPRSALGSGAVAGRSSAGKGGVRVRCGGVRSHDRPPARMVHARNPRTLRTAEHTGLPVQDRNRGALVVDARVSGVVNERSVTMAKARGGLTEELNWASGTGEAF